MKTYRVGVILSTVVEVEAEDEEKAEELAVEEVESSCDYYVDEVNFVEEV